MESKINYTLVGLFIVLLSAGTLGFAYWLSNEGSKQDYDHYHVYISESVAGLSTDAAVKFRGVNVGTVEHIGINPRNSEQVELLLKVKKGTPIKEDTRAKLQSFGITGITFIELIGSSKNSPLLREKAGQIAVIPSAPSTYAQIDESLRILAQKSNMALDKFEQLLSEENLANVSAIMAQTKMLAEDIRARMPAMMQAVNGATVMENQVSAAADEVADAAVSVQKMADMLTTNYAATGKTISRDLHHSMESFNQLTYELEMLSGNLRDTVRAIESSPADLLFKRSVAQPGPGEEGYNEN